MEFCKIDPRSSKAELMTTWDVEACTIAYVKYRHALARIKINSMEEVFGSNPSRVYKA
jgi:hypothetical protein